MSYIKIDVNKFVFCCLSLCFAVIDARQCNLAYCGQREVSFAASTALLCKVAAYVKRKKKEKKKLCASSPLLPLVHRLSLFRSLSLLTASSG